jgi:hypothetical protein
MSRPLLSVVDHGPAEALRVLSVLCLIASLGGFFRALSRRLSIRDALVSAGVSGLAGVVIGAICMHLWGPEKWYLTCAVVGASSWMPGAVLLDTAANLAWKLARSKFPALPESAPRESEAPTTRPAPVLPAPFGLTIEPA